MLHAAIMGGFAYGKNGCSPVSIEADRPIEIKETKLTNFVWSLYWIYIHFDRISQSCINGVVCGVKNCSNTPKYSFICLPRITSANFKKCLQRHDECLSGIKRKDLISTQLGE